MFDGWTKNSTNFVAMIFSYIRQPVGSDMRRIKNASGNRLALIALSPMGSANSDTCTLSSTCEEYQSDCDCNATDETTNFNAITHLSFFREQFSYFAQDFDDWTACLVGDNCSTDKKISMLCKKPLVGCMIHKLNWDVNKMMNESTDM